MVDAHQLIGPARSGRVPQAVFVDRDGVIFRNRDDYIKSWSEVEFLPGTIDALVRLRKGGCRVMLLTNQSAIGRGIVLRAVVDGINHRLSHIVSEAGGRIDAVLMCPHAPAESCGCRKPLPGLFHQAEKDFAVDLASAWLIGDQLSDAEAAMAAGVTAILVRSGGLPSAIDPPPGCLVSESLSSAADLVLKSGRPNLDPVEVTAI